MRGKCILLIISEQNPQSSAVQRNRSNPFFLQLPQGLRCVLTERKKLKNLERRSGWAPQNKLRIEIVRPAETGLSFAVHMSVSEDEVGDTDRRGVTRQEEVAVLLQAMNAHNWKKAKHVMQKLEGVTMPRKAMSFSTPLDFLFVVLHTLWWTACGCLNES